METQGESLQLCTALLQTAPALLGIGQGLASACSSCPPSCSPNPVWGHPQALHLQTGKNRNYSSLSARLPAAPAMTLSRPRSPSTSHGQPGSCVPQDLGKGEDSRRGSCCQNKVEKESAQEASSEVSLFFISGLALLGDGSPLLRSFQDGSLHGDACCCFCSSPGSS